MSPDLLGTLRRIKPEKQQSQLKPRPAAELLSASSIEGGHVRLVPDTNVYINIAQNRLTDAARGLLGRSLAFHCAVCLGELAIGIAAYDPAAAGWSAQRNYYTGLIDSIGEKRILIPDAEVWLAAGVAAGTLSRTQGYEPHQRKQCLNDALILLTAAKAGLPVLTANRDEFDLLQQVARAGQFIHY